MGGTSGQEREPSRRGWALARLAVRVLRITVSTVAVVSALRQQWPAAVCFAIAWLLVLQAPRLSPELLERPPETPDGPHPP